MNLDEKVNMLINADNKQAYEILKELIVISEKDNQLYSYFDCFVEMMRDQKNSFKRTRGLSMIAYNSKWDKDKKVNALIEEYLTHIEDEKPITSRQCIKDTVVIAKYKPELIEIILRALEKIDKVYADSMQPLVYKDRQKAIRQIRQYTW